MEFNFEDWLPLVVSTVSLYISVLVLWKWRQDHKRSSVEESSKRIAVGGKIMGRYEEIVPLSSDGSGGFPRKKQY